MKYDKNLRNMFSCVVLALLQELPRITYFFRGELVPARTLSATFHFTAPETLLELGDEPVVWDFKGALIHSWRDPLLGPEFPPRLLDCVIVR